MKFKYKEPVFYFTIMFVVCLIVSILIYPSLPADLPMQFSSNGEVNWTMPKIFGIALLPAISLFLCAYYKSENRLDYSKLCVLFILLLFDIAFLVFVAYIH